MSFLRDLKRDCFSSCSFVLLRFHIDGVGWKGWWRRSFLFYSCIIIMHLSISPSFFPFSFPVLFFFTHLLTSTCSIYDYSLPFIFLLPCWWDKFSYWASHDISFGPFCMTRAVSSSRFSNWTFCHSYYGSVFAVDQQLKLLCESHCASRI